MSVSGLCGSFCLVIWFVWASVTTLVNIFFICSVGWILMCSIVFFLLVLVNECMMLGLILIMLLGLVISVLSSTWNRMWFEMILKCLVWIGCMCGIGIELVGLSVKLNVSSLLFVEVVVWVNVNRLLVMGLERLLLGSIIGAFLCRL